MFRVETRAEGKAVVGLDVPDAELHAPVAVTEGEQAGAADAAAVEGGAELGGMLDAESTFGGPGQLPGPACVRVLAAVVVAVVAAVT